MQARRLIEAGVRLVSVVAWMGTSPHDKKNNLQTWDMHGGQELGSIFGTGTLGLGWALPCLDEAVSALLEDLELRGLLESTLVVVVGEFGRTPKIEANGGSPAETTGRTVSRRCWRAPAFAAARSTGRRTGTAPTSRTGRSRPTISEPPSSTPWGCPRTLD